MKMQIDVSFNAETFHVLFLGRHYYEARNTRRGIHEYFGTFIRDARKCIPINYFILITLNV